MSEDLFIDDRDKRILELVSKLKLLNMAEIARSVKVSKETIRRRIRRLTKFLQICISPNYEALGLTPAILILKQPSRSDLKLLDSIYLCAKEKMYQGGEVYWLLLYFFPSKHLEKLQNMVLSHIPESELFIGRRMHPEPDFSCYDLKNNTWRLDWRKIGDQIREGTGSLNFNPIRKWKVDIKDLHIIRELERDGLKSIAKIARYINVNPRALLYHFHKHVVNMVEGYRIKFKSTATGNLLPMYIKMKFYTLDAAAAFINVFKKIPLMDEIFISKRDISVVTRLLLPDNRNLIEAYRFFEEMISEDILQTIDLMCVVDEEKSIWRGFPPPEKTFNNGWILEEKFL
ncbi:MAG: Lrp/AsnC family transcriptional regulator [Thermoproteales archaeon]|nr:Lrp/AsnC family transcriptional regulator [Thermoproteales archaeon]